MESYHQNIETLIKQFNSNSVNGLGENEIESARKKYGNNILKA
jgi:hypothetical protein